MEKKENRSVFVLYEDGTSRTSAVHFCDHLIERFWTRCAFDISWVSFEELKDRDRAAWASEKAASSDMIVMATHPTGWLPGEIRDWAEALVNRRHEREGVLFGLGDPGGGGEMSTSKFAWIRQVAHRAGLDYLTQAPEELGGIADSPDAYSLRAKTVTSVLDGILQYHPLPRQT